MTIVFSLFTVVYLCILPFLSVYTRGVRDINYIDERLAFLFVALKMVTTLRSQSQNSVNFAGGFKETQRSAVIEMVSNIVISIVGIQFIGIYGVLIGSIISTFYRGISVTNYVNKNILHYSKKEAIRKYVRWGIYCAVFIIISSIVKTIIPTTVDNYVQWIMIALPITVGSIIIYGVLWFIIDKKTVSDAWKFCVSKIKKEG